MKANGLIQTIGNKLARVGFGAKKHSPEILIVAGITGTIVSVVIACKATLKINSVLEEMDEQLDIIRGGTDNEKIKDQYSEEDKKKRPDYSVRSYRLESYSDLRPGGYNWNLIPHKYISLQQHTS